MDRRGLELPFGAIITGFFLLAVAVLIYLVFFARILDLHVIVAEYEAEIHAINLAQVLLSSNLTYSDGYTSHRGIFDKSKLDNGELNKVDIWYPDAIAVVGIEDLETGKQWSAILTPKNVGGTTASDLIDCLLNTIEIDITIIFRLPRGSLWEWPDLIECVSGLADQIVPYVRDFPVAIRVSDSEIHRGKMTISLRELVFSEVI
ncbi:MAG: hypothetical protein ACE5J3_05125 [Methanosarcinales archaeon]